MIQSHEVVVDDDANNNAGASYEERLSPWVEIPLPAGWAADER